MCSSQDMPKNDLDRLYRDLFGKPLAWFISSLRGKFPRTQIEDIYDALGATMTRYLAKKPDTGDFPACLAFVIAAERWLIREIQKPNRRFEHAVGDLIDLDGAARLGHGAGARDCKWSTQPNGQDRCQPFRNPYRHSEHFEHVQMMRQAMHLMNETELHVLCLHIEGIPTRDIAEIMKTSHSNVQRILRRCALILQNTLGVSISCANHAETCNAP